jgi:hypothetical protein
MINRHKSFATSKLFKAQSNPKAPSFRICIDFNLLNINSSAAAPHNF